MGEPATAWVEPLATAAATPRSRTRLREQGNGDKAVRERRLAKGGGTDVLVGPRLAAALGLRIALLGLIGWSAVGHPACGRRS